MTDMNQMLIGKVALVTGGARGMGEAESRLFVEHGAQVIIGDILHSQGQSLANSLGESSTYLRLDVTDEANWSSVMAHIEERFGGLDILVNNAGILKAKAIEETSLKEYMEVVNVNQVGTFLGMRSAIPLLKKRAGGSIVNISSADALMGSNGLVSYAASKWAVRGMTKVAARELGQHGVRVNSIHPGGITTPMIGDTDDWNHDTRKQIPLYRAGAPEEVADMVLFLASDQSSYTTGGEFSIDGGLAQCNLYEVLPGAPEDRT